MLSITIPVEGFNTWDGSPGRSRGDAAAKAGGAGEGPVWEVTLMKLSARNVIKGKVVKVTHGAVNSEVILEAAPGVRIVAIITRQSAESLNLAEGADAFAVVKASSVMIAVE